MTGRTVVKHCAELDILRRRIREIEGEETHRHGFLSFELDRLDDQLPKLGLSRGVLHEVAGGDQSAVDGAAPACFIAGIAGRLGGEILWCSTMVDIYAPALQQSGLPPDRVIFVEAPDEHAVLACMEDGLRHGGLAAVVGEMSSLPMTASRRLHLAAAKSGTTAFALRRWRRLADAADFGQPTAAETRWRITPRSSAPLPVPGVGRARWHVELLRARSGSDFALDLEACDDAGYMAATEELMGEVSFPGLRSAQG